ncbi:site-specific integrase [Arthrobacter sp. lap29]|uniref:site-specific integrase n=1 Tax=Arthrobacter sp. lap29 TaxID=3056122 RepID=UPI0028F70B5F|nr:site-specific integrase [Arthrobacter sp. lap29]
MRAYDGKPRMYQATAPTGAQAEAALLAKLNAMLPPTDDVISPDMVMSELSKFWWLEFEDLDRAANTRRRYREVIDTYILPGVGNLTIREANVSTLDKFLKGVRTKHGNATAKMTRTLLSGMLSLATRHGAAPANPLREVARIPSSSKEVRALTIDEVAKLRHAVSTWQQPTGRQNVLHEKDILEVVDIQLATGARIGEALAIHWADVDVQPRDPPSRFAQP